MLLRSVYRLSLERIRHVRRLEQCDRAAPLVSSTQPKLSGNSPLPQSPLHHLRQEIICVLRHAIERALKELIQTGG